LYNALTNIRATGVFSSETSFVADNYRYILENVKDKNVINGILNHLNEIHAGQKNLFMSLSNNYYDVVALAYNKLGDKTKATEAQNEYEKKKGERDAYLKNIINSSQKEKEAEKEGAVSKKIIE
jgi:predicted Zn-dependent protease